MLKNILNLEGAQKLTKNEQKNISGGVNLAGMMSVFNVGGTANIKDTHHAT